MTSGIQHTAEAGANQQYFLTGGTGLQNGAWRHLASGAAMLAGQSLKGRELGVRYLHRSRLAAVQPADQRL